MLTSPLSISSSGRTYKENQHPFSPFSDAVTDSVDWHESAVGSEAREDRAMGWLLSEPLWTYRVSSPGGASVYSQSDID